MASVSPPPEPARAEASVAARRPSGAAKEEFRWATLLPWAWLLWVLGTTACLLRPALGRVSLWRLARASRRIDSDSWAALVRRAAEVVGLRRHVTLLQSDVEPMPMVWGVWQPKLLLPAGAESWSPERRWVVLLHELAHARRRDCLTKLIAQAACAAYWFNPLCWWAFKRMQNEAEAACDDLVLASGHRPSDYATHLLEIVSGLKAGILAAYSSVAMADRSKLEGRLLAILDGGRNRRAFTRLGMFVAVVLVVGLAVLLSVLRAPTAWAQDDIAGVPPQDLRAGGNARMRYFLIGPATDVKAPPKGYRLLIVMPGGDGSEGFRPFVTRIWKHALGKDYIVAQPVAVKWQPEQTVVWPTKASRARGQEFTTEQFIAAVIKDVSKRHRIDERFVLTLSWSSSGPAAYQISLDPDVKVTGSLIAMSVFRPEQLPPLKRAAGHAYYLLHSPEDRKCPIGMAHDAVRQLRASSAEVHLATYPGGHGWRMPVFPAIRKGMTWLVENMDSRSPTQPTPRPAQHEDMERLERSAWRMTINLDTPNRVPLTVQWAVLDEDPAPGFRARAGMMQGYHRKQLERAEDKAGKALIRSSQMRACWDSGFKQVTGDKVYLLTSAPGFFHGFSSSAPGGKKWIVTKIVRINGKPVCWCIPVEVETGKEIQLTLTDDNMFDLESAFDKAMGESTKDE
ncbi:MAG: M56 family metallopeptidase [Phycisphaerae bacterium]